MSIVGVSGRAALGLLDLSPSNRHEAKTESGDFYLTIGVGLLVPMMVGIA